MSAKRCGRIWIVLSIAAIAACSGEPTLSSTAQEAVVFSTLNLPFPRTVVGSEAVNYIVISPATSPGGSFDTVTSATENCADFEIVGNLPAYVQRICNSTYPQEPQIPYLQGPGGEPNALCQFPEIYTADFLAKFRPVSVGQKSCAVEFGGSFGTTTVLLSGEGAPPPLAMRVQPASLNFGDIRVGLLSTPSYISIENVGSMPLSLGAAQRTGVAFALGGNTGAHTLAPGAVESLTVTCQPPSTAVHTGTVTISATGVPSATVSLRCQGTNSQLVPSPQVAQLVTRQHEAFEADIQIQNVGNAPATITSYAVEGDAEVALVSGGQVGPLGVGASTTARVRFMATTARASTEVGQLVVSHDGGTNRIAIMGEARPTEVSVRPGVIDFGAICAGTPAQLDVTVSATLPGGFYVEGIDVPAPFTLESKSGATFPFVAQGNEGNLLELTARVDGDAAGSLAGTLVVRSDAPMSESRSVPITAEVLPGGVGATPALVDFGAISALTPGRRVKVTNCDATPLMVTAARIEGADAAEFGIADPADPRMTIEPMASGEFLLVMSPGKPGAKQAQLVIEHSAGTTVVDLTGATIGESELGERLKSYYDCSAGGGRALWPVVLALLAIALPRRRRRR